MRTECGNFLKEYAMGGRKKSNSVVEEANKHYLDPGDQGQNPQ